MSGLIENFLSSVPSWVVYLAVFGFPFAEAAVLLGFVLPGEAAVVFGGVLAGRGGASLTVVLALAVAGAILGDSVGYVVGRRYGERIKATRLGRKVGEERWGKAEDFLRRRGPVAVFVGRFTALLRAMVPGAAGMARMHYRRFLVFNVLGGVIWASACVLGGWALGSVISRYISDVSYVVIGLLVVAVVVHLVKSRRAHADHPGRSDRTAHGADQDGAGAST
ncbi:MAG: DedA family protein [Marmoricola sp.]|nr:DedA family protein [Marmoricola sp.]